MLKQTWTASAKGEWRDLLVRLQVKLKVEATYRGISTLANQKQACILLHFTGHDSKDQ